MRVANSSGLTWVRTSKGYTDWINGTLRLRPGSRDPPLTLPKVVTTATLPAGTMKRAWPNSSKTLRTMATSTAMLLAGSLIRRGLCIVVRALDLMMSGLGVHCCFSPRISVKPTPFRLDLNSLMRMTTSKIIEFEQT